METIFSRQQYAKIEIFFPFSTKNINDDQETNKENFMNAAQTFYETQLNSYFCKSCIGLEFQLMKF